MLQYHNYQGCCWYDDYTKLSNNQTAGIAIIRNDLCRDYEWCVLFAIANKKKKVSDYFHGICDLETEITGKCGMEGLIWAYHEIEEFIEILESRHREGHTGEVRRNKIVVEAADSRRFRVYEHFLKRLGFRKQVDVYGECLIRWC